MTHEQLKDLVIYLTSKLQETENKVSKFKNWWIDANNDIEELKKQINGQKRQNKTD